MSKKSLAGVGGGWVGGVRSIQVFFGIFEFFNFAKPLNLLLSFSG